jgi:hypothetical protein
MRIAIIGAGAVGGKLAALFSAAGHAVVLGVRNGGDAPASHARASIEAAVERADVVLLAIPYTACQEVLPPLAKSLAGKIVVDATNPLRPDWTPLELGERNSAGEENARRLPGARFVKAFNTIFADVMVPEKLVRGSHRVTAFVAGDDRGACDVVADLARGAGFAPLLTGPLRTARQLESIAHLNIHLALSERGGTNAAFVFDRP